MAELDYAYLADFAAVQEGKLTAVGASFTFLRAPELPAAQMLSIAGRIRARVDEGEATIRIEISPPNDEYNIAWAGSLEVGADALAYGDGLVGLLFALNTSVPLPVVGLYTIRIFVNDEFARRLAFEVELPPVS